MKREIYDADHDSFRDSVRSFLDREVKPNWDKYIEAKQFPREMWLAFMADIQFLRDERDKYPDLALAKGLLRRASLGTGNV